MKNFLKWVIKKATNLIKSRIRYEFRHIFIIIKFVKFINKTIKLRKNRTNLIINIRQKSLIIEKIIQTTNYTLNNSNAIVELKEIIKDINFNKDLLKNKTITKLNDLDKFLDRKLIDLGNNIKNYQLKIDNINLEIDDT